MDELFKNLVKELFELDNTHEEYQDNDTHFIVDSQKNGNTLIIKVQLLENEDKKNFEKWLKQVDDDLFSEVLDSLKNEGLVNLNEMYNSENYNQVISKVKDKTKEIAIKKMENLKKLLA